MQPTALLQRCYPVLLVATRAPCMAEVVPAEPQPQFWTAAEQFLVVWPEPDEVGVVSRPVPVCCCKGPPVWKPQQQLCE